ncbi:hypothetical protein GCM10023210_03740 [Chryseobacterium ginsengisoli]|uniref:Uncharacterized protein n=1 Tax=Chryseobacterium ginsengisoli TaxID=363853 RepID=A0ABP9LW06_9FLAO
MVCVAVNILIIFKILSITKSDTRGMIFNYLRMFFSAKINKSKDSLTLVANNLSLTDIEIQ